MKKAISILLVLSLFLGIFTAFGVQSFAAVTEIKYGGLSYSINTKTKTATVTGLDYDHKKTSYAIPTGVPVKGAKYTVNAIGKEAFRVWDVKKVTIPKTVTSIAYAGLGGYNLSSINIPSSVKSISAGAFNGAENLKSIQVEKGSKYFSAAGGVLYNKAKTRLCACPASLKTTKLTVPGTVKVIDAYAFIRNQNIKSIKIPASVTAIGGCAFIYSNIRIANILAKAKTIPQNAFKGSMVTNVFLSNYLTTICNNAFYDCYNLKNIRIPKNVTTIGAYAFEFSGLNTITFAKGSKFSKVGRLAFGYKYDYDWENDIEGYMPIEGFRANYFSSDAARVYKTLEVLRKGCGSAKAISYNVAKSNVIKNCAITVKPTTYTGKVANPVVTIKSGTYTLIRNVDFTVSCKNVKVGKAVVTIKGIGDFTGATARTFTIYPRGTVLK